MSGDHDRPESPSWHQQGACRGMDPDAFFPSEADEAGIAAAKAVCRDCPVRETCFEWAMTHRETEGIWGGTDERDRRRIRRQRRLATRAGIRPSGSAAVASGLRLVSGGIE